MRIVRVLIVLTFASVAIMYWWSSRPKSGIDWSMVGPEISLSSPMEVKPFTLANNGGKAVALESLRGKPILLNFWAAWCAPCVEELPTLLKFAEWSKANLGLEVLAVSMDPSWNEIRKLFEEKKLWSWNSVPITILLNTDGKVAELYSSTKYPESFFINKDFKVIRKFIGPQNWMSQEIVNWITENSK